MEVQDIWEAGMRTAAVLLWGKVRRAFLVAFRKDAVTDSLSRRRGACNRCGACCKLLFNCPAYDDSNGDPKCLIYNDRPGVCGLFPLDGRDLRDRDLVMPGKKCGYWFDETPGQAPKELRWGPPKGVGPLSILRALFLKKR